jgi:hypothetical protein
VSLNRGRLLFPLIAELARLDTNTIATNGAYDPQFKTYKPDATTPGRKELPSIFIRAQVEMGRWEGQQQMQSGNVPDSRLTLVFHFRDLERAGLTDPNTGDALIRVNDRLVTLKSRNGLILEQTVRVPSGGLYATEVQPAGLGLGGRRNLLVATFDKRPQGLTANP